MSSFLFKGLKAMNLHLTITGTAYFMDNIVPNWYTMTEARFVSDRCIFNFVDSPNLPESLRNGGYTLSVKPHPEFSAIIKEVTEDMSKYYLIDCMDGDGKYFCFRTLQKPIEPGESEPEDIHIDTTVDSLLVDGYTLIRSGITRGMVFCDIYKLNEDVQTPKTYVIEDAD